MHSSCLNFPYLCYSIVLTIMLYIITMLLNVVSCGRI